MDGKDQTDVDLTNENILNVLCLFLTVSWLHEGTARKKNSNRLRAKRKKKLLVICVYDFCSGSEAASIFLTILIHASH